jgi:flagellar biosynthesis protein FlhF
VRVKTFEAVDMKQALRVVRDEMGPAAVIVSTRTVRRDGALFGLLGRSMLEVTAAVEDGGKQDPPAVRASPFEPAASTGGAGAGAGASRPRTPSGAYRDLWAVKQAVDPVLDEMRSIRESVAALEGRVGPDPADVRSDLAQIRTLLAQVLSSGPFAADAHGAAAQRLFYFLLARGIDESLARSLVQRVVSRVEAGQLGDVERLKLNLAAEMRADLLRAQRGSPPGRVQVFVGPSGVGKTTTIAKLAARAARSGKNGVAVISTDVHRVAAAEQIGRYGEILDVPVEVAVGPDDLGRALARAKDREHVLVDTAGRSHRDPATIRELARICAAAPDAEIMLVVSATTRAVDSREILEAYSELPWSRLIVTKLDETRVYGELYNCVVRSGRPIACVTTGQAVPEHLEALDVGGCLRKILHG